MIDTANETRCKNPSCRKPITYIPGHRRREYCNDTCKQTAYRLRKEQPHHGVTIVDDRSQQRIAELEQELARYRKIVDLSDRQKMVAQFMLIGEEIGYKTLESVDLQPGPHTWYAFSQQADDELLGRGIVAAKTKWKHQADLQTTTAVAESNKVITDLRLQLSALRQELEECKKNR